MSVRNLLIRLSACAAVVVAAAAPSPSWAQNPTASPALLEAALAQDLADALATARALKTEAAGDPGLARIDALEGAFDRIQASDLLIADNQERVRRRLDDRGAPTSSRQRHAAMQALTRERMGALSRAAAEIRDASAAADRPRLIAAIDALIAVLESVQQHRIDRTPLGAVLPYRPLSLPQVAPALGPAIVPAYAQERPAAPLAADTAAASDVPLDGIVADRARELGRNPIAIFEFVQNQVATEFYHGAMKGARQALAERSGNAVDKASLLVALLRASGVPARYVRGVIRVRDMDARRWTATASMRGAADLFTRAGIPFTPVRAGGVIAAVDIEHTWVTAFVPYRNYRGAPLDAGGQAWIPLDPSFTTAEIPAPRPFPAGFAFDADALADEYLAHTQPLAPLPFYVKKLSDFLQQQEPGAVPDPYLYKLARPQVSAGLLGSTLPYETVSVNAELAELPAALRHTVRFAAQGEDGTSFEISIPASDVLGRRVTLSYVPATVEDQLTTQSFLGLDSTPAYLVKVRPVLKIGGATVTAGEAVLQMGSLHAVTTELRTPRATVSTTNNFVAGGYYAFAFASASTRSDTAAASEPGESEHEAAAVLFRVAAGYQEQWNAAETSLAELLHAVVVRPIVSQVITGNVYNRTVLFGEPQAIDWRGVFVDADVRVTEAVPFDSAASSRDFLRMSALAGSMLEGDVLQQELGVDAVSAAKLIQLAHEAPIAVRRLDAGNIAAELPLVATAEIVKTEISDAVRQGWEAIVPQSDLVRNAWSGIGYVLFNPATGAAGYFISGGLAGGMSSLTPQQWVQQELATLLGHPYSDPPNTDPNAAFSIRKVTITDAQDGVAGELVPRALAVWVRDAEGRPVENAVVTFSIVSGGGSFDSAAEIVANTDSLGVATARPLLGKSTAAAPFYLKSSPSDVHVTRVGENLVTARVRGVGGEIPLETPFQLFGYPGVPAKIVKVLGHGNTAVPGFPGGTIRARVEDGNDNPVSNVMVRFAVQPALALDGALPATARNLVVYPQDSCTKPNPVIGDCNGQPDLSALSTVYGVSAETILGDTLATKFSVEATSLTGTASPATFELFSAGERDYSVPIYLGPGLALSQLQLVNDRGQLMNSTAVGTEFRRPLGAVLALLMDNYTVEPTGASCGLGPSDPDCYRINPLQTTTVRTIDVLRPGKPIAFPQKDDQVVTPPSQVEFGRVEFVVTAGGGTTAPSVADQPAHNPGDGLYVSRLTVGAQPALNIVQLVGQATVWVPYVDLKTGLTTAVLATLRPGEGVSGFTIVPGAIPQPVIVGAPLRASQGVFGVRARIPDPAHVLLGTAGAALANTDVAYTIEPAEYSAQSAEVDLFSVATAGDEWMGLLPGTAMQGSGHGRIHRGTGGFDAIHDYRAELVLNRGSEVEIRSARQDLSAYLTAPLGVDFRSRAYTAEHSRQPKKVDLGAELRAEKAVLRGVITSGLAAAASCGVPASQLAILEQGSGACFWRPGFDANPVATCAAFHPTISDHDYEVLVPSAYSAGTACLIEKLNSAGDIDNLGDVSFFAVPREEFAAAKLNIDAPTGGGADTTGDLGLGRQSLVLKWALEGEYVKGVAALPAPALALDTVLDKLRTTPIIEREPTGIPRLEGHEWAKLQLYNLYKSGAHVRMTGSALGPKSSLFEIQQKQLHDVAKAGIRAAMGRLIASAAGNPLLFISRQLYQSEGGCATGTEDPSHPRLPRDLFPKACDSFEEHVASSAVRSLELGLGIFTPAEVALVYDFYRIKADTACAAATCRTQLVDETEANSFVAATLKFIEDSAVATKPIYDEIATGGKDHRTAQRLSNLLDAENKRALAAVKTAPKIDNRVLNVSDLEVTNISLDMFSDAAPAGPLAPWVIQPLPRVKPISETIVDVVRDGTGNPVPDPATGHPQRIFKPSLPSDVQKFVSFRLDPVNRIRECDKADNFTGFFTYPLDRTNATPPSLLLPAPPSPLPASPAPCASTPRPMLKLEKLVNGQPHIKVASHTPVQVTHVITNTGTTTLQGVQVTDLLLKTTFGPITLTPGQRHTGFSGTYTPTDVGMELVGPSEAIAFDVSGEGIATAWDSIAIDVVQPSCPLAIVPLEFDPNTYVDGRPVSTVMEGGMAIRHYMVRGASASGLAVNYTVDGVANTASTDSEGRIIHTLPDGGGTELGLAVDTSTLSGPGTFKVQFHSAGGSAAVCSEPFYVEVTPREFTRGYTAGSKISAEGTIGIGLTGEAGFGLAFNIDERHGFPRTKLGVERSINAAFGIQEGGSTGHAKILLPGVAIGGYAGAKGQVTEGVTVMVGDAYEFAFPAGSPSLDPPSARAFGGLLLSTMAAGLGPYAGPLASTLFEAVGIGTTHQNYLNNESLSVGVEVSASGGLGAVIGVGAKDKSKSLQLTDLKYGIGGGVTGTASGGGAFGVELNFQDLQIVPSFEFKGKFELSGFIGVGEVEATVPAEKKPGVLKIKDDLKASFKYPYGGSIKGKLKLDSTAAGLPVKELTFSASTYKGWGWQVDASGYTDSGSGGGSAGSSPQKITVKFTISDKATIEKVLDQLVVIGELQAVRGVAAVTGLGALLGPDPLGPELEKLLVILADSEAEYEVSVEDGNGISLPIGFDVGGGAKLALAAAVNFDRSLSYTTQKGLLKRGTLYLLERYKKDAFIPDVPSPLDPTDLRQIVDLAVGGIGAATSAAVDVVKAAVLPNLPVSIRSRNTAQLDFDGSAAPFSEITLVSFPYQPIAGPVAPGIVRPADPFGPADLPHYGIGGFHNFMPKDAMLSAPGTLRIEYTDAQVASVDERTLAIYLWNDTLGNWEYLGGTVDPVANTVTTTVRRMGLYTAAPMMPGSRFTFASQAVAAGTPDEPATEVAYASSVIRTNTGQVVPDGTMVTVRSLEPGGAETLEFGAMLTADADPLVDGTQVATSGGVVSFSVRYPGTLGAARILANSTRGVAIGDMVIPYK